MHRLTREELKGMMDRGDAFVLIDARGHGAYKAEHLPGAVSVPSDHVGKHLLEGLEKTDTIITYCSSFACEASGIAAEKLRRYGFTDVREFSGGLKDWKEAGYPTEK